MSSSAPVGLTIMEKLVGLIMIAVGAVTLYTTYSNLSSLSGVGGSPLLFLVGGIVLIIIGIFLVIAETE